jgi:hypothetical protein
VVGQSASLTSFLSQHRSENFTPTPIFLDVDVLLLMALHCESDTYTGAIRLGFDSEAAEREVGATVLGMTGSAGAQTTVAFLLEQFQIRRDGARRGLVEVLL